MLYPKEKLVTFVNTLVRREIPIPPNSIYLHVDISIIPEAVGKEQIVYDTMRTSNLRRMTYPTRFDSYTAGLWV